jgi:hypothetical protein
MLKKTHIILFASAVIFSACDKVQDPYGNVVSKGCDNATTLTGDTIYNDLEYKGRKVLVEEFTGVSCGYCPKGAKQLLDWETGTFKGKMVMVAIHEGQFAVPKPPKYTLDFRNEFAKTIGETFPTSGHPAAMFSRLKFDKEKVLPVLRAEWDKTISGFNFDEADVRLLIRNIHSAEKSVNNLEITVIANKAISANLALVIQITEDSIFGTQKDYNKENPDFAGDDFIEEYYHRHVLRGSVGGTFGNPLTDGMAAGDTIYKCFEPLIDPAWNRDHVEFVVYVMDSETYEVLQVDKVPAVKREE